MIYDVIIIGSGPAGMSAAMFLKRANLNILLIEKDTPGGQVVRTGVVENYPGCGRTTGLALAQVMYEQITELKVPYIFDSVIFVEKHEYFQVETRQNRYFTKNIIIATGTKQRKIGVPGEEEFFGRGVSYCAICDANFYKNENVVVIGGGNSAFEEGLYLSKICKQVTLLARSSKFRADYIYIEKAMNTPNLTILNNKRIVEFIGNKVLEKIKYEDILTKEIGEIETDGAFIYVGSEPATKIFKSFDILDENGYIIVNEEKETNVPGIYAVGDCTRKPLRQILTATSDGAIAASTIIRKLTKE